MKKTYKNFIYIVLIIFTLASIFKSFHSNTDTDSTKHLKAIYLLGEYSLNGSAYMPFTQDTYFGVSEYNTVTIRGHFSNDIPSNMQLLLRIGNVNVQLSINGKVVYSTDKEQTNYSRTPGNGWKAIAMQSVTTQDEVEFAVSNVYRNGNPQPFSQLLNGMYIGYENDLARQILATHSYFIIFGFLAIPLGLLLLFSAIVIRQIDKEKILSLAVFSISVGMWMVIQPNYMSFLVDAPQSISTISQVFQFLQIVSITSFVKSVAIGKMKYLLSALHWVTVAFYGTATINQFFDGLDYYDFTALGVILIYITCAIVPFALSVEAFQKNTIAKQTLYFITPLVIFCMIDQVKYAMGHYYSGTYTQIGFILFLIVQAIFTVRDAKNIIYKLEQAQRVENELLQSRISVMLSQIQPHFLYNSLGVIRELCHSNPTLAEAATVEFSDFLRGNLDSLKADKPVDFGIELAHTKHYLELEKLRFADRLKVSFCIETSDFRIPTLTLQPMVENAIRYGVGKREEGGYIVISAIEYETHFEVTVMDDGVGFDINTPMEDSRTHIGIENVRQRLWRMSGGTLKIESKMNEGTTAKIILPKEVLP